MYVARALDLTGREAEARRMCDQGIPEGVTRLAAIYPVINGQLLLMSDGAAEAVAFLSAHIHAGSSTRLDHRLGLWSTLAVAYERLGNHQEALGATREWVAASMQRQAGSAKAQAALLGLELQAERDKRDAQRALVHAGKLVAVGATRQLGGT